MSGRTMRRGALGAVVALALSLAGLAAGGNGAMADPYPGLDDLAAAQRAVSDQRSTVAQLDAAIVQLEDAAAVAQTNALLAADHYVTAQALSAAADKHAAQARATAREAANALDDARVALGRVAQGAYQAGGSLGSFEAILTSEGFEDVVGRSEANSRAAEHVDGLVQRVRAADVVAQSTAQAATEAADKAADAKAAAAVALSAAQDAQRVAEQAVADAGATRVEAVARLAALQRTSVELEEQRQRGLEAERAEAARAAYERALEDASGGTGGTDPGTGGTDPGTGGTDPGTGGTDPGTGGTDPGTGGTDPGTGGTDEQTGAWRSTASQGQAAADHALTLMGRPYQLGGNGPNYDCSGLTSASWKSVGYSIPRSSQTQYNALTHVPLSQMRPGDLVFYGTGRSTTSIYHVAIYIGNGMVAEATSPGKVSQIRAYDLSWRINDLIPYAGRP